MNIFYLNLFLNKNELHSLDIPNVTSVIKDISGARMVLILEF
jgi:hypothetical protein